MLKFKRTRRFHISLAAKCQLLFGAAVVAVIFAALYWPWKRIEQLTQQLNQNAASAVVRDVIGRHIAEAQFPSQPTLLRNESNLTTAFANKPTVDGHAFAVPRLIGIWRSRDSSSMTHFEAAAMERFEADPTHAFDRMAYRMRDDSEGYLYAEPQYLRNDCLPCHADGRAAPVAPVSTMANRFAMSALRHPKQPTTAATAPGVAAAPVLLGLVSVDMPSRIPPYQLLLNHTFLLTAALGAGSLALLVFSYITTRIILAPMRVLQETAEKVSKGDLNVRSDIFTGDEFQQLSETFNAMLINLKDSADQLRAVNKSLDIKLGQLAETNVALYESNRLKSEFLANVSHELRTPLNSILGFADLLNDQAKTADPKTARYLQNIMSAGNNLLDLINDLLDLAKIEAGRMEVRSEPLSLSDLLEGLANLVRPLAEKKSLQIVSVIEPGMPILQTDPLKLQQILYNFISNAIKFSPNDGRIELTARLEGSAGAVISVVDQGPGIDAVQQEMIFEKFRQIDGSVTRQHSGSGLGLAISRELATLLGGTVGVVSAPSHGATFWIKLPLKIEGGLADVRTPSIRA